MTPAVNDVMGHRQAIVPSES